MSSEKIRVGVVGTGQIADFLHLPALQSHPQAAYDGYKTQQVIEAALKAHREGKWISITESHGGQADPL